MLFSEPKIPQSVLRRILRHALDVSVLFSEPKIPQSDKPDQSAFRIGDVSVLFSEPKIPQSKRETSSAGDGAGFSALQRAENSSIATDGDCEATVIRFSALQRAENSSMFHPRRPTASQRLVSVLFSEPKIPQFLEIGGRECLKRVSVLFSEPKIPQSTSRNWSARPTASFSALQRAENSSMASRLMWKGSHCSFQCSSASRKFLNRPAETVGRTIPRFQCSSASRKFLTGPRPTRCRC